MALDSVSIVDAVGSHAKTLGQFEQVILHEPRVAPGNGMSLSIWTDEIETVAEHSGLAATSARVQLWLRLAMNMFYEPRDDLDPKILGGAVDALFNAYHGDFTLNGRVAFIDLLGAYGERLKAKAGYLEQDKKLYRVMTINLPLIVNDVWEQEA